MKKLVIFAVFLSLVCIGVIGVMILINSRINDAVQAQDYNISSNIVNDDEDDENEAFDNDENESGNNDANSNDDTDNSGDNNLDINDSPLHNNKSIEEVMNQVGEDVYNFNPNEVTLVEKPESLYVLVNKKNALSESYEPEDLTVPDVEFSFSGNDPKRQMRKVAADALEELINGAKEDGLRLVAVSGYRSYSRQSAIYQANVNRMGEEAANMVSAKPGQSEHQTGLAMDVSCESIGYSLDDSLGDLPEGQWLAENAHEYGFIIRYQKDKTEITGYSYEPWHVRYVGIELATYLFESDLTLEEFYEQL
jgi:D-alanyl-D-alanine carboxypeptidase